MWFHKVKDWEVWWMGYWKGLVGNNTVKIPKRKYLKGNFFLIYNDGWDEGIKDRIKLNNRINDLQ